MRGNFCVFATHRNKLAAAPPTTQQLSSRTARTLPVQFNALLDWHASPAGQCDGSAAVGLDPPPYFYTSTSLHPHHIVAYSSNVNARQACLARLTDNVSL